MEYKNDEYGVTGKIRQAAIYGLACLTLAGFGYGLDQTFNDGNVTDRVSGLITKVSDSWEDSLEEGEKRRKNLRELGSKLGEIEDTDLEMPGND